jgi:hypothetical protein
MGGAAAAAVLVGGDEGALIGIDVEYLCLVVAVGWDWARGGACIQPAGVVVISVTDGGAGELIDVGELREPGLPLLDDDRHLDDR